MAADDVTSLMHIANFRRVHKAGGADEVCRDEKVAAPAPELKRFRDQRSRRSRIIEGQQKVAVGQWAGKVPQCGGVSAVPAIVNGLNVTLEFRTLEFVSIGICAGKTAAGELAGRNDVVIEQ